MAPKPKSSSADAPAAWPKCEQQGCDSDAAARVFWPGAKPLNCCALCTIKAQHVGQAMGRYIHAERIEVQP